MGIAYRGIMKFVCKIREITVKFGCIGNETEYKMFFIYKEKFFRITVGSFYLINVKTMIQ